jgi:hypothetical protein
VHIIVQAEKRQFFTPTIDTLIAFIVGLAVVCPTIHHACVATIAWLRTNWGLGWLHQAANRLGRTTQDVQGMIGTKRDLFCDGLGRGWARFSNAVVGLMDEVVDAVNDTWNVVCGVVRALLGRV